MKIAIVGGAGVRVPLLVNGLVGRGLAIDRVALFDVDRTRLQAIARLAGLRAPAAAITCHDDVADCVDGADFVVTSIRVGGLASRQHDEQVSLAHGVVGQETVGPGGFAMAMRTIPMICAYAEAIARRAPRAWVINFTNPVGIVTQAMCGAAGVRAIGICDTPTELFAEVAHAIGVDARQCAFDYIGLNHLGWLREVYCDGRPLLEGIWSNPSLLARLYSRPLFPPAYLSDLRLLPTEYVYYYAFPERALENTRASGTSRGAVVNELTTTLFAQLQNAGADSIAVYEHYLATRSASYMQIESGLAAPVAPSPWAELTGYDRIAFDVIDAIVHDRNTVIPLNVANRGNIPELAADDVVEVPCAVGRNGPRALHVGALPPPVVELVQTVKRYERKTIEAAASADHEDWIDALASNPLVPSRELAARLIDALAMPRR
jgi:6-phospho-beta-glucosidase